MISKYILETMKDFDDYDEERMFIVTRGFWNDNLLSF